MTDLPEVMRGWHLTGHGGPEMLSWRTDLPVPRPGPGEVLIDVGASSVNNTDINTRVGWYSKAVTGATSNVATPEDAAAGWAGSALSLPRVQGADCCGRIVAVGADVAEARIGARVLVRALQQREDAPVWTFGAECDGGFADYAVARSVDALDVVSNLPDTVLAALPCAYGTAQTMVSRAAVSAGDRVIVTGASGGVGAAAVQLCALRGAEVVAQCAPAKAEAVRALGASATISRDDTPAPDSADVIVDLVGGPAWPALIAALVRRGRYVVSGAIAGPIVPLDLRDLYLKDLTFLGSTEQPASALPEIIAEVEAGRLVPSVAARFALADLPAAQEAFQSKRHVGKIVLDNAKGRP
ncbi:zinc-binding dehydrogenase [Jannaschia seohaensis]|uniref:NADPH:quinone reductase n=1 Tax=Jannaschia seohaensis TaxID=475081 RepID=A0A2Y9BXW3_9RHOB|nr:zinc-binding dehydrogenase [Jannaschia seohaensis]PWJ21142.1 NADPH:quinone reductase-like Zn-dependent oxidoreductase [Jannaschia seohaensis]SSA41552.1 NADPH:quinone reductase [Jannaschia seohaensis]